MVSNEPAPVETGVSFVVTVYNKAAHLPTVIEGLRRQVGNFDREFIFVDDGSIDDSAAVIERETADLSNVTIVRQRNAGPSWAINAGLAQARFPYVKGLDGDDVPAPRATSLLLDAIRTTGCPVAYGTHRTFRPGDDPFATRGEVLAAAAPVAARIDHPLDRLIRGRPLGNPSAWLASRALLLAAGGADPKVFIQDVSIELRMAARGSFAWLDYPVFLSPQEADRRLSDNQLQILHDVNRAIANFCAEHPGLPAAMRRRAARRLTGRAWKWAHRKNGRSVWSPDFWRYVCGMLALGDPLALMDTSCRSFAGAIRVPPRDRDAPALPSV